MRNTEKLRIRWNYIFILILSIYSYRNYSFFRSPDYIALSFTMKKYVMTTSLDDNDITAF